MPLDRRAFCCSTGGVKPVTSELSSAPPGFGSPGEPFPGFTSTEARLKVSLTVLCPQNASKRAGISASCATHVGNAGGLNF